MSSSSYHIYGQTKRDGVGQSGQTVTVRNNTKGQQVNVTTASDGSFVQDLDDTFNFTSGYADGDVIWVTWAGVTRVHTVAGKGTAYGAEMSFEVTTKTLTETLGVADLRVGKPGKTLSDGVGFADGWDRVFAIKRTKTETLGVADVCSRTQALHWSLSEGLTFADSISRAIELKRALQEGLGLADSRVVSVAKKLSTGLSLADSFSRVIARKLAKTETLELVDGHVFAVDKTVSDSLVLAESAAKKVGRAFAETFALTDSVGTLQFKSKTLTETLELADSWGRVQALHWSLSDGLAFADGVSRVIAFERALQDSLGLADSRAFAAAKVVAADTLGLTDGASVKPGKRLAETLNFADSRSHVWTAYKTMADSLLLGVAVKRVSTRHLSESLQLGDLPPTLVHTIGSVTFSRTLIEDLLLADSYSRVVSRRKALVEALELQDSFSHASWLAHKSLATSLLLADASSKFAQHLKRVLPAEVLNIDDLVPGRVRVTGGYRKTFTETLQFSNPQYQFLIRKVIAETLGLEDSVVHGDWLLYRTLSEGLLLRDVFDTSLYGVFYGTLRLAMLPDGVVLRMLYSDLSLAQLRAALELVQQP